MRTAEATVWARKRERKKLAASIYILFLLLCLVQVLPPYHDYVSRLYVFACLNVKSCACVHVASLKSQKTLSVKTAGPGSSNLVLSDAPVLFTCVVSSCRWTASASISLLELPFLSWHKHWVVLVQSICLLSERERALHIYMGLG